MAKLITVSENLLSLKSPNSPNHPDFPSTEMARLGMAQDEAKKNKLGIWSL